MHRRLFANAHYDFSGRRRLAYKVTGALLLFSLLAGIFWEVVEGSWLKYGVDFTGGTIVQVAFQRELEVGELRDALSARFPGAEITRFGEENEYLIRTPVAGEATSGVAEALPDALTERFGEGSFTVVRTEAVGAKVGGELQTRAILAILLSFAATLIYLAFRFEWRFGVASIVATAHDVLLTLGLISLLQLEVALPTVAALLTIVGYSLNDTIVIFDRIRENLHGLGRRGDFAEILNRSINETLPRTVLTGTTSIATLLALFTFGTGNIREFALIMIAGIILGTYSSIFVASPVLLEIDKRWPADRRKPARAAPRVKAGV
jgi:preprotein translocase subunit SecF